MVARFVGWSVEATERPFATLACFGRRHLGMSLTQSLTRLGEDMYGVDEFYEARLLWQYWTP